MSRLVKDTVVSLDSSQSGGQMGASNNLGLAVAQQSFLNTFLQSFFLKERKYSFL